MSDPQPNILPYARKPSALASLADSIAKHRRRWIKLSIIALLLMLAFTFLRGPTRGQIRLDTGDLRYCWYGIPLQYKPMPEPQRSKLLALAANTPKIPAKWVTCVEYPLPTSNNTDLMCRDFYHSIAIWADEDPSIARWALDDVVNYIPGMLSVGGLPNSHSILFPSMVGWGAGPVNPGWQDTEEVKAYCADHGYVPPPPRVAPSATLPV